MNSRINIILVDPENPDNIGASVRAIRNMGLSSLRLVRPPRNWKRKAKKMAMHGADFLDHVQVFETLQEAVSGTSLVLGTSRRLGPKRGFLLPYDQAIKKVKTLSRKKQVSIVFGRESKGLDNDSLRICDAVVRIPSSEECPSLNLAQAVMVVSFSLSKDFYKKQATDKQQKNMDFVPRKDLEDILDRFYETLRRLNYQYEGIDIIDRIRHTFHRLLKRSNMLPSEVQMFKGYFRRICERLPSEESVQKTFAKA